MMIKGRSLKKNSTSEERRQFIELADEMFVSTPPEKNDLVWDSLVLAISNTMDREGIANILENREIDRIQKARAIDQNAFVLVDMLKKVSSYSISPSSTTPSLFMKASNAPIGAKSMYIR